MLNLASLYDQTAIYHYFSQIFLTSGAGQALQQVLMHAFRVFSSLHTSHASHGRVALCEVTNRRWCRAEIALLSQNHSNCCDYVSRDQAQMCFHFSAFHHHFIFISIFTARMTITLHCCLVHALFGKWTTIIKEKTGCFRGRSTLCWKNPNSTLDLINTYYLRNSLNSYWILWWDWDVS